jgi:hypothetical protein
VIVGSLSVATPQLSLVGVLLLVGLDGLLAITVRALLKASLVATTSPADLLREGNALLTVVFTACMAIGPVAAGAVVAFYRPPRLSQLMRLPSFSRRLPSASGHGCPTRALPSADSQGGCAPVSLTCAATADFDAYSPATRWRSCFLLP